MSANEGQQWNYGAPQPPPPGPPTWNHPPGPPGGPPSWNHPPGPPGGPPSWNQNQYNPGGPSQWNHSPPGPHQNQCPPGGPSSWNQNQYSPGGPSQWNHSAPGPSQNRCPHDCHKNQFSPGPRQNQSPGGLPAWNPYPYSPLWPPFYPAPPMMTSHPVFYVTCPTPYYVSLNGGVMMEQSQDFRPTPVYGNRKRPAILSAPEPQGGEVTRSQQQQKDNLIDEVPKKNRLEPNNETNQPEVSGIITVSQMYREVSNRNVVYNIPLVKGKTYTLMTTTALMGQGRTSTVQSESTTTDEDIEVDVVNIDEPDTIGDPLENVIPPKQQLDNDNLNEVSSLSTEAKSSTSSKVSNKETQVEEENLDRDAGNHLKVIYYESREEPKEDTEDVKGRKSISASKFTKTPLKRNISYKLDTVDPELYNALQKYVPTKEQLKNLGYPIMLEDDSKTTLIYKQQFVRKQSRAVPSRNKRQKSQTRQTQKICGRCGEPFYVNGVVYLTMEKCHYHWGRVVDTESHKLVRECCNGDLESLGCSDGTLHVWSGINDGENYLKGFAETTPSTLDEINILGVDCEMIYTRAGMEVASVALVDVEGSVVFQALVRAQHRVIDCNTRFSGITLKDLDRKKKPMTFQDMQKELLKYVKSKTILVGHSLENDLRVLKLVHPLVVDTSIIYPHQDGLPSRRSLKDLAKEVLGLTIQNKETGHDPVEDAWAALSLALHKVKMNSKTTG